MTKTINLPKFTCCSNSSAIARANKQQQHKTEAVFVNHGAIPVAFLKNSPANQQAAVTPAQLHNPWPLCHFFNRLQTAGSSFPRHRYCRLHGREVSASSTFIIYMYLLHHQIVSPNRMFVNHNPTPISFQDTNRSVSGIVSVCHHIERSLASATRHQNQISANSKKHDVLTKTSAQHCVTICFTPKRYYSRQQKIPQRRRWTTTP